MIYSKLEEQLRKPLGQMPELMISPLPPLVKRSRVLASEASWAAAGQWAKDKDPQHKSCSLGHPQSLSRTKLSPSCRFFSILWAYKQFCIILAPGIFSTEEEEVWWL